MLKGAALLSVLGGAYAQPDEYDLAFSDFVKRFRKEYSSDEHVGTKFENFKKNYITIARENAKGVHKYTLAVNEFSDMSWEEFRSSHLGYVKPEKPWGDAKHLGTVKYNGEDLPDSVDWTTAGAVTPVKNQAHCGSCWAFSTTGGLEGALFKATGKLVSLSEEQFVQCSTENNACQGGSMPRAFEFAEGVDVCTEDSYPYTSGTGIGGSCHSAGCTVGIPKGGVTGYHSVSQDMQSMMQAVAQQPVSIAVEADKSTFQSYSTGVMTGMCGTKLDHGILCVGYGTLDGTKYWIVKNSWGSSWGDMGYAKLERGKNSDGECGILDDASYPEVTGTPGPAPPSPSPTPPPPAPPAPPSPPSPPSPPTPGCSDVADFCKKHYSYGNCPSYAVDICKQTCGCCGSNPPSICPKDTVVV